MTEKKYCCEKFAHEAGRVTSSSPMAAAYPSSMHPSAQFEITDDGSWAINGCCGGGCYVVTEMEFCPYCGTKLRAQRSPSDASEGVNPSLPVRDDCCDFGPGSLRPRNIWKSK